MIQILENVVPPAKFLSRAARGQTRHWTMSTSTESRDTAKTKERGSNKREVKKRKKTFVFGNYDKYVALPLTKSRARTQRSRIHVRGVSRMTDVVDRTDCKIRVFRNEARTTHIRDVLFGAYKCVPKGATGPMIKSITTNDAFDPESERLSRTSVFRPSSSSIDMLRERHNFYFTSHEYNLV